MLNANTGLCSQVRPNFPIAEVTFALRMRRGNLLSGSISKINQLTNLTKGRKFHACIHNSTILDLSLLAIILAEPSMAIIHEYLS